MQTPIESTARFTAMPDDETLETTVAALAVRGFGVEVVDDLDAAREAVLARIPHGASVATNSSVTLEETGIASAINDGGPYDSARKVLTFDRATQMREIKALIAQPAFALGSVHAVTRDGMLVLASALGSQIAAYACSGAPRTSSWSSARRSSCPTSPRHTSGSTGTACRSRTSERSWPTGAAATSARSSRSTRTNPAAPTSS